MPRRRLQDSRHIARHVPRERHVTAADQVCGFGDEVEYRIGGLCRFRLLDLKLCRDLVRRAISFANDGDFRGLG